MSDPIVITHAYRTPIGQLMGKFSDLPAYALGSVVLEKLLSESKLDPTKVDEVIMGCVLSAGQGQAPARQAAIGAGLPQSVPCTTINKMCGSGMKAVMMGCDALLSENAHVVFAGGMESMTQAPYLLPNARKGMRMGHHAVKDHMFLDGLEDAYEKGTLMGVFAEKTAEKYGISRKEQDDFALASLEKAQNAIHQKWFHDEVAPVTVQMRKKPDETIIDDELPLVAKPEKIPQLKPAFAKEGTVTAANASAISDGASALCLMRQSQAKKLGLTPLAKIQGYASHAHEPAWFTTAPIGAIKRVLEKANWQLNEVDCFEINEAFAVVTLAAIKELSLDPHKVNIHGGACALGHPIGASGARIITTLIHSLRRTNQKKGIAALCIGGGEGTAIAVELLS